MAALKDSEIHELLNIRTEFTLRDDKEVAWAAGLFEGEGSCYIDSENRPRMELSSTDEDVVMKFYSIVGCGSVNKRSREGYKDHWRWSTKSSNDIRELITVLRPFLCERRTGQVDLAMERISRIRSRKP